MLSLSLESSGVVTVVDNEPHTMIHLSSKNIVFVPLISAFPRIVAVWVYRCTRERVATMDNERL